MQHTIIKFETICTHKQTHKVELLALPHTRGLGEGRIENGAKAITKIKALANNILMVFRFFLTPVAHSTYQNDFVTHHKLGAFAIEPITSQNYT